MKKREGKHGYDRMGTRARICSLYSVRPTRNKIKRDYRRVERQEQPERVLALELDWDGEWVGVAWPASALLRSAHSEGEKKKRSILYMAGNLVRETDTQKESLSHSLSLLQTARD